MPLATRLAPVVAFGAMLIVRNALTVRGADATQSGVVLGRFYSYEMGGALLPPIKPFAAAVVGLTLALALGVGIAPLVAMLGGWRARVADRQRLWLALFAVAVAAVYVLAAARHTVVVNGVPKIHERYVFAVGPLFLALFFAEAAPLGATAIALTSIGLAAVIARFAHNVLPDNTWVSAPSTTLPWLVLTRVRSGVVIGVLLGASVALVCWCVRRVRARRGTLALVATLAVPLLALNVAWYAFIYGFQNELAPLQRTLAALESGTSRGSRITTVVSADRDPMAVLSYYGKFWLEDRLTVYWASSAPPPWYVDSIGPVADAARATRAAYLVGLPGEATNCAGAARVPLATTGVSLPVEVVVVPPGGCAAPPPR